MEAETSLDPRGHTRNKRPHAAVEPESETTTPSRPENGKRRRRKLSCETCQRLKCRCDYDPVSRTCHRCKTLRRPCSITDDDFQALPQPNADIQIPNSELKARLQALEESVADIKVMVRDVQSSLQLSQEKHLARAGNTDGRPTPPSPDLAHEDAQPEDISDPADAGIASAPAIVMRTMTTRLAKGRRRVLEHFDSDLVELGILDDSSADRLIRLFCRHRDSGLLVRNISQSEPSKALRRASPFLHSVCCLHGIPYGPEEWPAISVRRQVYQQVRLTLGQALVSSPLPLDEINAILMMSVYANAPSLDDSPLDYIDSWLLTGYCAQQAMLSISFSTIVANVRRGNPTNKDRRAITLWANICLHHLHWAATTGRPSTIPGPYLTQCNMLLSLFEATINEGMILAEILLYTALNRKLTLHSYLDSNGECEEFAIWKQKWVHLFALPRSSAFKLSFHSAYFILAVRNLEDFSSGRAAEDLVSPSAIKGPNPGRDDAHGQKGYQERALWFAVQILETFLEMSSLLRTEIPIYLHMCVSYSALVIAQYWGETTAPTARINAEAVMDLLVALEEWCAACPSSLVTTRYSSSLAKRRVQAACSGGGGNHFLSGGFSARQKGGPSYEMPGGEPVYSAVEGLLELGGMPMADGEHHGVLEMSDLDLTPGFPSMEDFFGGGFLDFMR